MNGRTIKDGKIIVNSLSDMTSKIKSWDESDTTIVYAPFDKVWYFISKVFLGKRGLNYFSYVDKSLIGRHDNPKVNLRNEEVHEKVNAKTKEDLIQKVLTILR